MPVEKYQTVSLLLDIHSHQPSGALPMAYCAKAVLFTDPTGPIHRHFGFGYNAFGFGGGVRAAAGAGHDSSQGGCCNSLPTFVFG